MAKRDDIRTKPPLPTGRCGRVHARNGLRFNRVEDANYNPRTKVASHEMKASEVDEIYPGFELGMPYLGEE